MSLYAGSLKPQNLTVEINDIAVGSASFYDFKTSWQLLAVDPALLQPLAENTIQLTVPSPGGTAEDPRQLGIALRSFGFDALPSDFAGITYRADTFFIQGFSGAESGWRWTDGPEAIITYPIGDVSDTPYILELTAGTLGRQQVQLTLDGHSLADLIFEGFEPTTRRLEIPPGLIRPTTLHRIRLVTPDAVVPVGETRRLGLAFVSLVIAPADKSSAAI